MHAFGWAGTLRASRCLPALTMTEPSLSCSRSLFRCLGRFTPSLAVEALALSVQRSSPGSKRQPPCNQRASISWSSCWMSS